MDRGFYSIASGGLLQLTKLDVVNNNLANVNTPGFKRQLIVSQEQQFANTLAKALEADDPYAKGDDQRVHGISEVSTATDFTPGAIKATGNSLDVALRNAGDFFVVNTPAGPQYTRAGNFTLNANSEVVTMDGLAVQGDGGAIAVNGPSVKVQPNGQVFADGQLAGTLQVVHFDNTDGLERVSGSRFQLKQGAPAPTAVEPDVEPSSLEMSNVSAITSMIDLIAANRAFDMYSRTARSIDDLNQVSIAQVGKGAQY